MAFVKLEANWFGPDGNRYRKNHTGDRLTYIPDEILGQLPSTARIVKNSDGFEPVKPSKAQTLRDFDETRAIADAEGKMAEKAEAHRIEQQEAGAKRQRQLAQAAKMRAAKEAKKAAADQQ
jgi:hypothetical protein